ncbi:hypothetical protein EON63_13040 [archaeon]|nr:MAG: hypothetical protein EON63_13040 [archaeon]
MDTRMYSYVLIIITIHPSPLHTFRYGHPDFLHGHPQVPEHWPPSRLRAGSSRSCMLSMCMHMCM